MADEATLAVYAQSAARFADCMAQAQDDDQADDVAAFLAGIPQGGRILDLGCGPGQWAAHFRDLGFNVAATDATSEMVSLANETYNLGAVQARFDDLDDVATFNGVWANFSLLHAPKPDFPTHLAQIYTALTSNGMLHIAMKLGTGEARDHLGRFYSYYQEQELLTLLIDANFTPTRTRLGRAKGMAGTMDSFMIVTAHA